MGKTPLAVALSLRAIENWYGVCFVLTYPDADALGGAPGFAPRDGFQAVHALDAPGRAAETL